MTPVGIIAGGGSLPRILIASLVRNNRLPVIIGIEGFASPELLDGQTGMMSPLGSAGSMIRFFRQNNVRDIVITGKVTRPELSKVKPDARGLMILAKVAMNYKKGDDAVLKIFRNELERDGFALHGIQDYVPELLAPDGVLGNLAPGENEWASIRFGFDISQDHGRKDLGQSVVVQDETILGLEGPDGTDALIKKVGTIKSFGSGPILVKTCKPQQDRALDLPTIGIETIRNVIAAGFRGIVVQAGETLLVDKDEMIKLCNQSGLFLLGYKKP